VEGSAHARAWADPSTIPDILVGGDDYELLFTVPNAYAVAAIRACEAAGVQAHWVGDVSEGEGVTVTLGGAPVSIGQGGYRHF
jgi:thiamine-monophosphate kinase